MFLVVGPGKKAPEPFSFDCLREDLKKESLPVFLERQDKAPSSLAQTFAREIVSKYRGGR